MTGPCVIQIVEAPSPPIVIEVLAAPSPKAVIEVLVPGFPGPPGPVGPAGGDGLTGTAVAAVTMSVPGTPVYLSRADGKLHQATNDNVADSLVVGLLAQPVVAGFVATYAREFLTLSDWTSVTGSNTLLPGQVYFLAAAGQLTTIVPTTVGTTSTRVGQAANANQLNVFSTITPYLL